MRIDITKEQLRDLEYYTGERAGGSFGSNYNLNGEAFKYFEDMDLDLLSLIEPQLWAMSAVSIDNVALPKDIVYLNDDLVGYTREFFKGYNMATLLKSKKEISFEEVQPYLDGVTDTLYNLANHGIETYDVCLRNCIYNIDTNKYCFIDCDFYSMPLDLTKEEIYQNSIKNFLYSIDEDCELIPCITETLRDQMKDYVSGNSYKVKTVKSGGLK